MIARLTFARALGIICESRRNVAAAANCVTARLASCAAVHTIVGRSASAADLFLLSIEQDSDRVRHTQFKAEKRRALHARRTLDVYLVPCLEFLFSFGPG